MLYVVIGYGVLEYAIGAGSPQPSDQQSVDLTATLLRHPGGKATVVVIGLALIGGGIYLGAGAVTLDGGTLAIGDKVALNTTKTNTIAVNGNAAIVGLSTSGHTSSSSAAITIKGAAALSLGETSSGTLKLTGADKLSGDLKLQSTDETRTAKVTLARMAEH